MFGLLDRLYSRRENHRVYSVGPRVTGNGNPFWISFVSCPPGIPFTPKRGTVIEYSLSSNMIFSDPSLTQANLDSILNDAREKIKQMPRDQSLNLLGVSLGNVLSFRLAAEFPTERLVAVTPGANLSWNILNGIATQKQVAQARHNGFSPQVDYPTALADYNPSDYANQINPGTTVEVYLGTHDLMIPSVDGERLVSAIQKFHPLDVTRYRNCGHVLSILRASKELAKTL